MNSSTLTSIRFYTLIFSSALVLAGCSSSNSDGVNDVLEMNETVSAEDVNEENVVDMLTVDSDVNDVLTEGQESDVSAEESESEVIDAPAQGQGADSPEQMEEIEVIAPVVTPEAVEASLELVPDKTFRLSWSLTDGADFYRVLENPDGVSGFTQVSTDLDAETQSFDHRVTLYRRLNARYIVQACNSAGCSESLEQIITGSLDDAIGYLKSSNSQMDDRFGTSVSLSADSTVLAISAPREDSGATGVDGNENDNSVSDSGAVYIFSFNDGTWQQNAYLKASNTGEFDGFGGAISLSADGSTIAVGAPGEDSGSTGINGEQIDNTAQVSGAVYVFALSDDGWQQQAYVKASNTDQSDLFGEAVSLSANGDTLAVGARGEDSSASGINGNEGNNSPAGSSFGAAYVFVRTNGNWQQQAFIKASNPGLSDFFGSAVGLSADGNTLAVGAFQEGSASTGVNNNQTNNFAPNSGAVYVFTRLIGNWQQQAYIKSSNPTFDGVDIFGGRDFFGAALSISADGNTLAVGAYGEDSAAQGIGGDQLDNTGFGFGAVYVFERTAGVWAQQEYIKASNAFEGDFFGRSVSLSPDGDTLAVGANGEDSIATGINGDENADAAGFAGAVYLFERSNNQWRQQAYIKPGNPDSQDNFGGAVSLSSKGDDLAVGAIGESSAAMGLNGNQSDNTTLNAGAVYLY